MTMTPARSLLFFLVSAVAGGALMAVFYGVSAGLLTAALLMVTSAPVLVAGHVAVGRRERLGSLSRQFVVAVGLTVTGSLAGLWLISRFLFVSPHDAFTMALLLAFAAALTAYSAWMLASQIRGDIELVRDGLVAVGDGSRRPVPDTGAKDETAELAGAANRMVVQLVEREAERDAAQAVRHELVTAMVDQLMDRDQERTSAEEARRGLMVGISHDTRTPLTALKLLASAIADDVVDPDARRRYAQDIVLHVDRFSGLLDELFEFTRLEAGDVEWTMQRVGVEELVRESVQAIGAQAESKRVTVAVDVAPGIGPAWASSDKVRRVLVNLLENAVHHSSAGAAVTVSAEAANDAVEVTVADMGPGISPADRGRVFEPFFRGGPDPSRSGNGTGAGLGLSICRLIVEAHGGRIWIREAPEGTQISFTLARPGRDADPAQRAARGVA